MSQMTETESEKLFAKGLDALNGRDYVTALVCFEKAHLSGNSPHYASYFAYCLAKERGQHRKAAALCREAIERDPGYTPHYLNLGKVTLLLGNKTEALQIFRQGLSYGKNAEISEELDRLGARKPPVIPFLSRDNFCNKYLGIFLKKVGLR